MKYVASCSFGKDSLAMVLRLLEENKPLDEVIFFDTGMEFDSIYNNRDKMRKVLIEKGVQFTELHDKDNFYYKMLVKPTKYRNPQDKEYPYHYGYEWCGGRCRWGTTGKLKAIKEHYKSTYGDEEVYEYVGIALDEPDRITDNPHKLYPLVEWGMAEKDCLQYCYDNGYDWEEDGIELYSVLDRVSCWCCSNKNLKELKNIYEHLPRYWQMLRGLQSRIDRPMKGEGKSIFQLEERFEKELAKEGSNYDSD
jgi:3'-phosphoadenosine 5'-phosphosulfate sulfotransferase (PAPS reductase)/FAD synthetase